MIDDPLLVALSVGRLFERLGLPYVLGGSLASTLHGEPRTTADVDFALQLGVSDVDDLVAALEPEFFVQATSVRSAAEQHGSFNAIHRTSMLKVDVYVRPAEGLFASEVERAVPVALGDDPSERIRVASPEDTILQKLRWFRLGGDRSERQWRDVRGVVKAVGARLDRDYLGKWGERLGLTDLLERLESEAR